MPSRHISWAKRLSFADLHIPPFLAPRVSTPRPSKSYSRKTYATTQSVDKTASAYIDESSRATFDGELDLSTNSWLREGKGDLAAVGRHTDSVEKDESIGSTCKDIAREPSLSTSIQGAGNQSGSRPLKVQDVLDRPNQDFLDAYQQIWGAAPALNKVAVPLQQAKATLQLQNTNLVPKDPTRGENSLRKRSGRATSTTSKGAKSLTFSSHVEAFGHSRHVPLLNGGTTVPREIQESKIYRKDVDGLTRFNDDTKLEEQRLQMPSLTKNDSSISESSSQANERALRRQHKARKVLSARCIKRRFRIKTMPLLRPRYQRYASDGVTGLKFMSNDWSADFAGLSRRFDNYDDGHIALGFFRKHIVKRGGRLRATIFDSLANISSAEFTEKWKAIPPLKRTPLWLEVMLYALLKNPRLALKFLVATSFKPYPPSYAMSDSLEYIVSYHLYRIKHQDTINVAILFHTIIELLNKLEKGYMQLTQKTLFWLISHLPIDKVAQLYSTLVHSGQVIHENTQLHFIDIFARKGWTEWAVKALRSLHDNGSDFAKPQIESVCATLLQRRYRTNSDTLLPDSELFSLMLDLGLRPNIIFYNLLIQNSIDGGDSDTAWQIHDTILEDGINADATTYSILLNDAKLRLDRPMIERIAEIVKTKRIRDEYIVTDLLHAMFLLHEKDRRSAPLGSTFPPPLNRMLPLFCEHFEVESTKELLISEGYNDFTPQMKMEKMRPPKEALMIMFIAVLKGFQSPKSTQKWYEHFRELVLSGHPDILPLVESTRIYDAVIMSFGKSFKTLHLCTKVISDMYSSHSEARKAAWKVVRKKVLKVSRTARRNPAQLLLKDLQNLETAKAIPGQCQPSVWTWSVLLKAFMDHKQPRAAEEVLNMMRSRGTPPNQVTWNSLAIGYAHMQDIASTVNTIERLENEGWEVSDRIMNSFQRIQNREALIQALLQKRQRRSDGYGITDDNANLVKRLVRDEDKMIHTRKVSHRRESSRILPRRWLRPPEPLKFDDGELGFPMDIPQNAQAGDEGSDISGTIDSNPPQIQDSNIPEEHGHGNQLADNWKRGWI